MCIVENMFFAVQRIRRTFYETYEFVSVSVEIKKKKKQLNSNYPDLTSKINNNNN